MESKIKGTLYFGHPVNTYNTKFEQLLLYKICCMFTKCFIENPNQLKHQEGYKKWKEEKGNGMLYYFSEVLPKCDAGIFLPFKDGKWGAGVYGEAKKIFSQGSPIFQIDEIGIITEIYSLEAVRALSIEETS